MNTTSHSQQQQQKNPKKIRMLILRQHWNAFTDLSLNNLFAKGFHKQEKVMEKCNTGNPE